jgi:large exoprotein involved in heme utilization and adhesion
VILENRSHIVADAGEGEGDGGNIRITADNYFAFPGTVVDASSDLGLDGVVEVNTPDVNLAGALAELPSNPLDAASQMKEPCTARRSGERAGSFAVRGAEGIPPEPDGWLPATVAREAANASGATPAPVELARPIPLGTGCR